MMPDDGNGRILMQNSWLSPVVVIGFVVVLYWWNIVRPSLTADRDDEDKT
jgi:hypothetical protein